MRLIPRLWMALGLLLAVAVTARFSYELLAPITPLLVVFAVLLLILTVAVGRHRPK